MTDSRFIIRVLAAAVLLLAPCAGSGAGERPMDALEPAAGAVLFAPHPHFRWQREEGGKFDQAYDLQIARDAEFVNRVCEDHLEVVSRFVPVNPLPPGDYLSLIHI